MKFIEAFKAPILVAVCVALGGCQDGAESRSGAEGPYDLLIRGGIVVDGSGAPGATGDVGIVDGRIVALGNLEGEEATRTIDANGLHVTPGFIDVHSHAGPGLATEGLSHARPLLAQGVTTVFINPDGGGMVDLAAQRAQLGEHGLGVNVSQLVPHGSVRRQVVGMDDRPPTAAEMERMKELVRAGMAEGAWGLSSGTFYAPGSYSEPAEIGALAQVVGEFGGAYTSHIRDESNYTVGVVASVEEVIDVARQAGIPAVVTHVKALGPPVWGASAEIVEQINSARAEGLDIYADQYPYTASATGLSAALLPRWAQAGGDAALKARLADPATLARIREEMVENLARRGGADRIQFRRFVEAEELEGKLLSEVAEADGVDPIDKAIELFRLGSPSIVSHNMDEADVLELMRQPWTMTSSDGDLVPWEEGVPHPRSYGAFSRKIAKYVVQDSVLDLQTAVHGMTGLPAKVFGVTDRGLIQLGQAADLAVFDPLEVNDPATFTQPHQLAEGMRYVVVEGQLAVDEGEFTSAMNGQVLLKSEPERAAPPIAHAGFADPQSPAARGGLAG